VRKNRYTFIDLFAGCGGLSEGFLKTGRYEAMAHVEWEKPMVDTLRNRLVQKWHHTELDATKRVVMFDIQKTDELINGNWSEESIIQYGKYNAETVLTSGLRGIADGRHIDMIIGGPPCQAYSIHGRATDKNSMQNDYRNFLFESFCKVVDAFKPEIFLFENVVGLLSAKPGGISAKERIYDAFTKIGYTVKSPNLMPSIVFNAADYDVPQERPRIIIIGIKNGSKFVLDDFYEAIKDEHKVCTKKTVRDAIFKLPKMYPLKNPIKIGKTTKSHQDNPDKNITQHDVRNVSEKNRRVFREWVENGMNHISHKEMVDYYLKTTGHTTQFQKYKSLEWDKASHTIVAHLSKDGYMFIHPDAEQERSITVREAACLQSFPMDFNFFGGTQYGFKMIGNAVPINFAYHIALGILKVLDGK